MPTELAPHGCHQGILPSGAVWATSGSMWTTTGITKEHTLWPCDDKHGSLGYLWNASGVILPLSWWVASIFPLSMLISSSTSYFATLLFFSPKKNLLCFTWSVWEFSKSLHSNSHLIINFTFKSFLLLAFYYKQLTDATQHSEHFVAWKFLLPNILVQC